MYTLGGRADQAKNKRNREPQFYRAKITYKMIMNTGIRIRKSLSGEILPQLQLFR
jgi:hypothetical protein